ncbi:MAG TPA: hypothetical protein V6C72_18540 [Chroococcales cyanobacterium]
MMVPFGALLVPAGALAETGQPWLSACHGMQPAAVQRQRLRDARRLTREAGQLRLQAEQLLLAANELHREQPLQGSPGKFNLEVEQQHTVPMSSDEYQTLLTRYREALDRYMQHRRQVEAHAVQYHDTVQQPDSSSQDGQQNKGPSPVAMALSEFRPIQWDVADACMNLQASEEQLHSVEMQLFNEIQIMTKLRSKMPPAQYAAQWNRAHEVAYSHQENCMSFDANVMTKNNQVKSTLQDVQHRAMLDGDQRELSTAYSSTQRKTAMLHQQLKQADMHSKLAALFMDQLRAIDPSMPLMPASTPANEGTSSQIMPANISDPIPLDQEFQEVQDLYRQIQEARPKAGK